MMTTNRSCEIHCTNYTSAVWYRHYHSLYHGVWLKQPKEALHPGETLLCLAECSRSFGSFSGRVQYALILKDLEYLFDAEFEIPVLGENQHACTLSCSSDPRKRGLPEAQKLFQISYSADPYVYSRLKVTIKETPQGKEFLHHCLEQLQESLSAFYLQHPQGLRSPLELPAVVRQQLLPMSFVWGVENRDWQKRLRKSPRSLLIRIVNLTTYCLVLQQQQNEVPPLEEGVWVEFPSEEIPPLCLTEFGCQSTGFLFGTGGTCTYTIPGKPGQFVFFWDQPGMGGCRSFGVDSSKVFRIFKHAENLNEGFLVFHIIDPAHPPAIQIVQARALPSQRLSSSSSSHGGGGGRGGAGGGGGEASAVLGAGGAATGGGRSSSRRNDCMRNSIDVTASFISYLKRTSAEQSSSCVPLSARSPRLLLSGSGSGGLPAAAAAAGAGACSSSSARGGSRGGGLGGVPESLSLSRSAQAAAPPAAVGPASSKSSAAAAAAKGGGGLGGLGGVVHASPAAAAAAAARGSRDASLSVAAAGGGPPPGVGSSSSTYHEDEDHEEEKDKKLFARIEISVSSPRAFFCALQSSKPLRGVLQPNSLLYLQWRIGSELFSRVFSPDERLHLHGGLVAGIEKNQAEAVLHAEPLNLRRLPAGLKLAQGWGADAADGGMDLLLLPSAPAGAAAAVQQQQSSRGGGQTMTRAGLIACGGPGGGAAGGLAITSSRRYEDVQRISSEAELLEVLFKGFRICAAGLQREVTARMHAAYGSRWLAVCQLPRQHVWKESPLLSGAEEEHIDLEGLLHIMTAFWDEVFEERIGDPQQLHALQAAVIYWATQELSAFDEVAVASFFRTAITLLIKAQQPVYAQQLQELGHALPICAYCDDSSSAASSSPAVPGAPASAAAASAAAAKREETSPIANVPAAVSAKSAAPALSAAAARSPAAAAATRQKSVM